MSATQGDRCRLGADSDHGFDSFSFEGKDFGKLTRLLASICVSVSVSAPLSPTISVRLTHLIPFNFNLHSYLFQALN